MRISSKGIITALFVAVLFLTTAVKAQNIPVNTFSLNVGAEGGLTTDHITNSSKSYIGATGTLEYGLAKNLALTLTSGYYHFIPTAYHSAMGMIPIKLGLKYFVGQHFYFSGEVGAGIELEKYYQNTGLQDGLQPTTRLLWSPGIGYTVKSWDFNLRYENVSGPYKYAPGTATAFGIVSLRVSHSFGL